jgi:protein Mpv17
VTTSFLFAVGDVAAQQLVDKKGLEKHDLARTGRMALYGGGKRPFEPPTSPLYPPSSFPLSRLPHPSIRLTPPFPQIVVFGPAAATWFKVLSRHVNLRSPNATILARVACDQGLFAPTFIGVFLSSMAVLEGSSPREKLARNYSDALLTNWMIWPFVQMVNFKLVPLQHRLLFVNVISIGWNCYLSFLNSS